MNPEEKRAFAESPAGRQAAQDYLAGLQNLNVAIALKHAQADGLREKVKRISEMPKTGDTPEGQADTITARLDHLEQEVLADYHTLLERRQAIQNTIRRVPNAAQRTVLEMRYVESMPFFRIAMAMNYGERTVFRLHRKALAQTALYLMETGEIEA